MIPRKLAGSHFLTKATFRAGRRMSLETISASQAVIYDRDDNLDISEEVGVVTVRLCVSSSITCDLEILPHSTASGVSQLSNTFIDASQCLISNKIYAITILTSLVSNKTT